mmetsp:Transcript_39876/g.78875  ORF Transcript_39876/g.78875 Transcript_39876/m.78875 type:complete len:117 (-) Transcript_39876:379-729(-)
MPATALLVCSHTCLWQQRLHTCSIHLSSNCNRSQRATARPLTAAVNSSEGNNKKQKPTSATTVTHINSECSTGQSPYFLLGMAPEAVIAPVGGQQGRKGSSGNGSKNFDWQSWNYP